jgi:hypothetical protein
LDLLRIFGIGLDIGSAALGVAAPAQDRRLRVRFTGKNEQRQETDRELHGRHPN